MFMQESEEKLATLNKGPNRMEGQSLKKCAINRYSHYSTFLTVKNKISYSIQLYNLKLGRILFRNFLKQSLIKYLTI